MRKMLLTPKKGSRSGSSLARRMGVMKLTDQRLEGFVGSKDTVVINWGNSNPPAKVLDCTIINKPEAVGTTTNKKAALEAMERGGVSIPAFTSNEKVAQAWVNGGHRVVARHTLTGSGGEGIQILTNIDDFPCEAPLYTLYIPKKAEYRFHVMNGNVFDVQRKMRRKDIPDDKVNWLIRNHGNGFIFGRNFDVEDPDVYEYCASHAKQAVKSLGLDFGAVDLIWNEKKHQPFVLEVNTAPGLEGTTLDNYDIAFSDLFFSFENKSPANSKWVRGVRKVNHHMQVDFANPVIRPDINKMDALAKIFDDAALKLDANNVKFP